MAIEIKNIPVLKDSVAKRFCENADKAYSSKGSIEFKSQKDSVNYILEKSKLS
jgi:hypothetical protein